MIFTTIVFVINRHYDYNVQLIICIFALFKFDYLLR